MSERPPLGGVGFNSHLRGSRDLAESALEASEACPPASHRFIQTMIVILTMQIPMRLYARAFRSRLGIYGLRQMGWTWLHLGKALRWFLRPLDPLHCFFLSHRLLRQQYGCHRQHSPDDPTR